MSRAFTFKMIPAAHAERRALEIDTYVYGYGPDISFHTMREKVYFDFDGGVIRAMSELTPDEARQLALQLTRAADVADEHRARRESLEEIEEQMRDEHFDARLVRFAHPDIVYAKPGTLAETSAANPGKLVIGEPETADEVPA